MRRAPASFPRALPRRTRAHRDSQQERRGNGAALAPGAPWDWRPPARPFAPRAVPFRASIRAVRRCPFALLSAPRRAAFLAPSRPMLASPLRALHGPSFPPPTLARATGPAGEPRRGRRAPSRAPFAFAPARHSRSHSARRFACHGARHFARRFSPPRRGARDTAHAREDRSCSPCPGVTGGTTRCMRL